MKRLVLMGAVLAAFTASAPAGACAARPGDNPCFQDPYVATVTGSVWIDADADGAQGPAERAGGDSVWADYDRSGTREEGEPEVELEPGGGFALPVDTRRGDHVDLRVRFGPGPQPGTAYGPACLAPSEGCVRTLAVTAGQRIDDVRFPVVGPVDILGKLWDDKNADGKRQAGEDGVPRLRVYLDDNRNAKLDPGEPASSATLGDGGYHFTVPTRYQLAGGALPPLRAQEPAGVDCTAPDDCAYAGLHTRSGELVTRSFGVARPAVIFIHGYGGSIISCGAKELWFNLTGAGPDLMNMRLDSDGHGLRESHGGTPCSENAGVSGLLMEAGGDIYGGASRHFDDITLPGRHFDYAWDWRQSPETAVPDLDALVEKARREAGVARVQLVAHSMGGLVAREYLEDAARAAKVQRVVTVGTPYWGSPKTVFPLVTGHELPGWSMMDPFLRDAGLMAASRTFPGHFALSPSMSYGPWLSVEGRNGGKRMDLVDVGEYYDDLGIDPGLLYHGASEHARVLDHYDDHGVDYEVIVGGGLPTIGSVELINGEDDGGYVKVDWVSGDETVPAVSGAHDAPREHLHYVCGISHVPLTKDPQTTRLMDPFIIHGEKLRDEQAECPWSAREMTVFATDKLASAAQAGGPRVLAGGRSYSLDEAERAEVVQVLRYGLMTKVVASADVRVEWPRGTGYAVRQLSEKGAGPERRFVDGKRVAKDTTAPRTTARRRHGKLVLRAKGALATYVIVKGKTRRYTKPIKAARGTEYFSVDAWGNAEKPRKA
jgi:pimeloyl-ACP methyl ester carboxylesterase